MTLTIVTVVKDDPSGLDATLSSIQGQSVSPNLLIVDGGSRDATLHVVQTWQESLTFQFMSEPDKGPYHAMNKALHKLGDEDLIWFVNAGDTLHGRDALERAINLTQDANFVWGFGPHRVCEVTGEFRRVEIGQEYSLTNHAYGITPICHQAVIARASILRQVGGFDARYPIAADYRSLLLLGKRWTPKQWSDVLVEYRAGGISDRDLNSTIREQGRIRREILQPRGESLVLDYLYDAKRLLRNRARQLALRAGINPYQLTSRARASEQVIKS